MTAPVGRPDKYNPEMCRQALDLMREGGSIVEVAAEIGVDRSTIYDWCNPESPRFKEEFSHTIKKGFELCQAWWERQGRENLRDKEFSYVGWFMNMKNRFKEDWRDRHEVKHEGEMTNNVNFEIKTEGEDPVVE